MPVGGCSSDTVLAGLNLTNCCTNRGRICNDFCRFYDVVSFAVHLFPDTDGGSSLKYSVS